MNVHRATNADVSASWRTTRVAQLLGIEYPIIQAPFGGLPSQALTAAVSNLEGLGSFGAVTLSNVAIKEVIGEIRSVTEKPFAINLWVQHPLLRTAQVTRTRILDRLESVETPVGGAARRIAVLLNNAHTDRSRAL